MKKARKKKPYEKLHKVVICGDRDPKSAENRKIVRRIVHMLAKKHGTYNLLIISGGAPGVDTFALELAPLSNVHTARVDALWSTRGYGAGPQRNEMMAALDPDEVIAVHPNIKQSKGTKNMLNLCDELGIKNRLVEK